MKRYLFSIVGLFLVTALLAGCVRQAATPTVDFDTVQVLAPIDAVEILIAESDPPQYFLHVVSGLPNGCVRFDSYDMMRDGDTIHVEVFNLEPADQNMVCTQVYGTVEHNIPLGSDFEPGKTFTVDVNGVIETFAAPSIVSHGGPVTDFVSLVDNLRAAGATVEPAGEVSQPFFSVEGQVITVNGEDVQVFEYADAASADVEAALVSPDGSSVGTTMVLWIATPHFYQTGQLIVLYVGDSAAVIDALEEVLGPQFAGG